MDPAEEALTDGLESWTAPAARLKSEHPDNKDKHVFDFMDPG
jgi:hypothetical protein